MQKHYQFILSNVVWKLQYGYGIGAEFSLLDKIKHRSSVLIAPLHCDIQIRYTYVLITTTPTYISWKSLLLSYKLVNLARVCGSSGCKLCLFLHVLWFSGFVETWNKEAWVHVYGISACAWAAYANIARHDFCSWQIHTTPIVPIWPVLNVG